MNKNSPLVAGIIGAIVLVLQQFVGQPTVDWKVVGLAAIIAVVGVVGTQLKGKGASVAGVIGTVAYTFYNVWQSGSFNWNQFIILTLLAVLALFSHSFVPEVEEKP